MAFVDDLAAAKADRDAKKAAYDAAQATYDALLAQAVPDGLDASEHNGDIDWPSTKAGFAFVRSADGDYNDKLYTAARVTALRAAGVPFGPYQYARVAASSNSQRTPTTEAAMAYYFAARQGWGKPGDLPLTYDVEQDPGESTTFQGQDPAKAAVHVVGFVKAYRGLAGHYPIVYTNPATWKLLSPQFASTDQAVMAKCPLWVAHWNVASPSVPDTWASVGWAFWQYTSTGTVAGITGSVDRDKFSGSKTDLDALKL